jgi:hypothetical protein
MELTLELKFDLPEEEKEKPSLASVLAGRRAEGGNQVTIRGACVVDTDAEAERFGQDFINLCWGVSRGISSSGESDD